MEEKERFLETIREVNDDKSLLNDWVIEENARQRFISQVNYAKEEGIEEGIERGIEQGSETKELEVIKNMLEISLDYSIISDVTGKSIEEIKDIENDIKKVDKL